VTRSRVSPGNAARRVCRRAVLLLSLLVSLSGCETLYRFFVAESDPDTRSADFSHFRDTLLDSTLRENWEALRPKERCVGDGLYQSADGRYRSIDYSRLYQRYIRETFDRAAIDLQAQGAACTRSGAHEYRCIYRQIAHCKTRSWRLPSADYRSDIELHIRLLDHPADERGFTVENRTKITRLDVPR
jgi:hypothetical protein